MTEQRRLAAILVADVVGYSKLVGSDETGTLAQLQSLRTAAVWYRADRPIVEGAPISPLMRAAIAADFCNGTSSVLDFREWTFINGDLTLSLAREPAGDRILLDAETWAGPDSIGIAAARLADRDGYFGRAVQSLLSRGARAYSVRPESAGRNMPAATSIASARISGQREPRAVPSDRKSLESGFHSNGTASRFHLSGNARFQAFPLPA
jgi:hypothetical protein